MTAPAPVTDVLFPDRDPLDVVLCKQPGCGEPLYMERTISYGIGASDTVHYLQQGEHTSSWSVGCTAGHVVLLPLDTAGDSYTFAECPVHDDDEHDESCDDMARLRAVSQ